ncbi:MAG: hypothetical protein IJ604_03655 [Prevotella sp.]|nr:hypothetical protein [Prevotella sp.]
MNELNKIQSIVFLVGGGLMVIGAGLYVLGFHRPECWIYMVGAVCFASMQLQQRYEGSNIVIRRLRRTVILCDICFLLAGLLMIENTYNFLLPLFLDYVRDGLNAYLIYTMNKWVVVLLVAAVLEVYTTHRMSNELEKEAKKR